MFKKLRIIIIDKFPGIYRIIKNFFRLLRSFSGKTASDDGQVHEDFEQYVERTIYYRNTPLMKDVFNNEYFVHHGPFAGMKYIQGSSGSAFLPKIVGSYEEPIHRWIEQIITNDEKYNTILNVGCAEGYYAVGFALTMPAVEIVAYDINLKAREKVRKMMEMNNVKNVIVEAECTLEELNLRSRKGTLVFCDIEGAEKNLLDPIKVPNLFASDILVESHDCVEPGLTELLINRFYKTHAIEIVVDYPSRVKHYEVPTQVSSVDYEEVVNEHRAEAMRWLYMKSLS